MRRRAACQLTVRKQPFHAGTEELEALQGHQTVGLLARLL
jgi:hypothetical protein